MKHLPSALLAGLLAVALQAQTPPPEPSPKPQPKPTGDPFVKNADDAAGKANAEDDTWKVCQLVFETYVLDQNDAAAVLAAQPGSVARYQRVLELAKAGKARLEILEGLTTKSGQRAIVEATDEVRYPTEFAPPESAEGLPTPTAWETRNVGDTFEIEPVIEPDGKTCDLNVVPHRVGLMGFHDEPEMPGGLAVSQPRFSNQEITTSTLVSSGKPHYLGTMTPLSAKDAAHETAGSEVSLAFLHASVIGEQRGDAKVPPKPGSGSLVQLEYGYYSMERAAARDLLVAPASSDTPWEKLQVLLAAQKARLEHLATVTTRPGQRAATKEIHEVRFMSEYVPESRVASVDTTHHTVTSTTTAGTEKEKDGQTNPETTVTETTTTAHADANAKRLPGYPSAFEARNIGFTFEVEPVVGPDLITVDLNHAVINTVDAGKLKVTGTATHYPAQTVFAVSKVTTSQTVTNGHHAFVGTMNPPGADGVNDRIDTGRTWVLFVNVTLDQ